MTTSKDDFAKSPPELKNRSAKPSASYELLSDRYAVHRRDDAARSADPDPLVSDDGKVIEIVDGGPRRDDVRDGESGPVYALQPGGTIAVPTGRIFITFKAPEKISEREAEIKEAGYEIVQTLDYAANACWLRHVTGSIEESLAEIPKLEDLPDVENVEPQMLMPRMSR
jgi:hypothetical protein